MGITRQVEEYEKSVLDFLEWEYKGLKWCEFGNQMSHKKMVAKKVYESYGVQHISMDLNGRGGALPIDLGQPVSHAFVDQFNVVTNYGTIEHINNQFQAFKNMHDMCKEDGIIIHTFPLVGNWPGHCRYYYSENFARELASVCNYHVVNHTILVYKAHKDLLAITYIKEKNSRFVNREKFGRIGGIKDTGNLSHTGDYTSEAK